MLTKLYDQTVLSDKAAGTHGDCTRACIKTVLQDDLPELPHPVTPEGGWNLEFFDALEERYGWVVQCNPIRADKDFSFLPLIVMAGGPTERTATSGASHMVVWDRVAGRCIHDPHPSRAGLLSVDMLYWLERLG
ncbi:MAG: hypothetical protein LCH86_09680 [Proteobacteria bacterium]|nr:hypothetical protein [Pseudomonadota bacterium]